MKVSLCALLLFVVAVHGGLLPHLEAPPPLSSHLDHSALQIPETKIVKLTHETVSLPHATLPTPPLKILKVIHESVANAVAEVPSKIIKLIHQSVSHGVPEPVVQPKIVKVIHHSAPVPVAAPAKLLKVIHEYAPRHYAPATEVQSIKVLKLIKQQTVTPHPVPVAQNIRVYKVFRQIGGATSSISHEAGQTYASGYGHATPASVVNVIKVLQKSAKHSW